MLVELLDMLVERKEKRASIEKALDSLVLGW
jgi:hypothetical protein